ncbi:MAG: germination protein YpeB [Bacillota bacterium]
MRRVSYWLPVGLLAAVILGVWGVWTYRLNAHNNDLANALEAERQRNFVDLAYHVEEIQALLGKGLVSANVMQNMRYMADVNRHASAAVDAFTSLPLPPQLSASTGKFLQQVGDFSLSLLRNEAAGRMMGPRERAELARLKESSAGLSQHMNAVMAEYNQGIFRWHQPTRFNWATLTRGPVSPAKPNPSDQAPASMVPGGFEQVTQAMDKLPVFIYDGPFSDHVDRAAPAVSGMPVTQEDAGKRLSTYFPQADRYRTANVNTLEGNIPAYSFQLTPGDARGEAYTVTVDITRNGGHLLQILNSRMIGAPTIDLSRAQAIGQQYLASAGYPNMMPTYGQVEEGAATIAYAYRENGVVIYPDQIKVKVALDNGEILSVDTRQYLMHHKPRTIAQPRLTADQARNQVNPDLQIQRVQLAMIPDLAGTGEILTYEVLTRMGPDTYLVYINAETGEEEQILQLIQTDGGTFTL